MVDGGIALRERLSQNPVVHEYLLTLTDKELIRHSFAAAANACILGRENAATPEEMNALELFCLHDSMKPYVSNPDVFAKNGKLSDAEYVIVQEHVRLVVDTLRGKIPPLALLCIAEHHEWKRRNPYPRKTHRALGSRDSALSQIVAVADCADVLLFPRHYANHAYLTEGEYQQHLRKELAVEEKYIQQAVLIRKAWGF